MRPGFKTDGCTLIADHVKGYSDYRPCCVQHDRDYWNAGRGGSRRQADRDLRDCVKPHHAGMARTMYFWTRAADWVLWWKNVIQNRRYFSRKER